MSNRKSANRRNAKKSTGPNNTTSTRLNATKHGLLSAGITELDNAEGYCDALRDLINEKDPLGVVETFLVECAALEMTRLRRAKRLEAEFITEALHPPVHKPNPLANFDQFDVGCLVDPGLPAKMPYESVQRLVNTFQRYETSIALKLFRILHELERVQRMRKGEHVSAPAAVDVTVSTHTSKADEFSEKVVLEDSLSTHPDSKDEPGSATAADVGEATESSEEPSTED
ncbi:MAG TPA: hypothetical protein VK208_20790 [Pyrinomonadaceae bacterium]|nr:hypothetical protein [Pyrinomonadaceae bacterium]